MTIPARQPLADPGSDGTGGAGLRRQAARPERPEAKALPPGSAWREAALVAAVVTAWGAVLYRPALRCSVISDGWHLLHIGSLPLREAVLTRLDYHFSPVAHLLNGMLWRAFGMRDGWYQAENLLSLGLLAGALYALARTLFADRGVALVALLLFLANASYFEVPLWPVVGNFQSFAALLYVGAIALAIRSGRRPRPDHAYPGASLRRAGRGPWASASARSPRSSPTSRRSRWRPWA